MPATTQAPEVIQTTGPGDKGISCPQSGGASSSFSPLPASLPQGCFFSFQPKTTGKQEKITPTVYPGSTLFLAALTDRGAGAHVPCPTLIPGVLSHLFILKQDTPGECESGESPSIRGELGANFPGPACSATTPEVGRKSQTTQRLNSAELGWG